MTPHPPTPSGRRLRNLFAQGIPFRTMSAERLQSHQDFLVELGRASLRREALIPLAAPFPLLVDKSCELSLPAVNGLMSSRTSRARPIPNMLRFFLGPVPEDVWQDGVSVCRQGRKCVRLVGTVQRTMLQVDTENAPPPASQHERRSEIAVVIHHERELRIHPTEQ